MYSRVDTGEINYAYLFMNGEELTETQHETYSESGEVGSTSGRVVTLEASAGDEIEIRTTRMDEYYFNILYCAEYIPRM